MPPALFLAALSDVAKARGMIKMAKDAGLGRESLCMLKNSLPKWASLESKTSLFSWNANPLKSRSVRPSGVITSKVITIGSHRARNALGLILFR